MARWKIVLRTADKGPMVKQSFEIEAETIGDAVERVRHYAPKGRDWKALLKDNRTRPICGQAQDGTAPRSPLLGMDFQE